MCEIKTKDLIIDCWKSGDESKAVLYMVVVQTYKYLGTVFCSQLIFRENTDGVIKQANQRTLAVIFDVAFYQPFIECLLLF